MRQKSFKLQTTSPYFNNANLNWTQAPSINQQQSALKLKLKSNLYSVIKSEDSEALDGKTSQPSSQREYGEIKMFWGSF